LTLAALEATLRGPAPPVVVALEADPGRLRERAERLAAELTRRQVDVRVVASAAAVGGGGAPGVELPSFALSLPERWLTLLRGGDPAVVGRVEGGRCLLDLRSVEEAADPALLGAVLACTS
jgi:L-seryl-tRNA(Ser) seleniumtransferase